MRARHRPGQLQAVDRVWLRQRPVVLHLEHAAVAGHVLPVLPRLLPQRASLDSDRLGEKASELDDDIEDLEKKDGQTSASTESLGFCFCVKERV